MVIFQVNKKVGLRHNQKRLIIVTYLSTLVYGWHHHFGVQAQSHMTVTWSAHQEVA